MRILPNTFYLGHASYVCSTVFGIISSTGTYPFQNSAPNITLLSSKENQELLYCVWTEFFLSLEQQFLLNRLADSAIDIYSMVVVISRTTRTLNQGLPSGDYETKLTKIICDEVSFLHLFMYRGLGL